MPTRLPPSGWAHTRRCSVSPAELEEGNRELIKIASINGDECLVRVLYSTVPERIDKEVRVERAILEAMLGRHLHGLPGVI